MSNNIFKGLPSKAYTDKNFWAKESKNIFEKNWVFVGFKHELKNKGDVLPINVAAVSYTHLTLPTIYSV